MIHDLLRLFCGQGCGEFRPQTVHFAFFLQMDQRNVAVIIADAELLPHIHAVQLFPQRLIAQIVEIKAANIIFAVYGVGVRFHHRPQPHSDRKQVEIV